MDQNSADSSASIRQALESRLPKSEKLIAFTTGTLNSLTTRPCQIGLTRHRLILWLPKENSSEEVTYSIWRDRIHKVIVEGWIQPSLQIKLHQDLLTLPLKSGVWKNRAQEIAVLASEPVDLPAISDSKLAERHLQQAKDFLALGMTGLAQTELRKAQAADPMRSMDMLELVQPLQQISYSRQAEKTAASFLFANVAIIGLFFVINLLTYGFSKTIGFYNFTTLISIFACMSLGTGLMRGQTRARTATITAALIGLAIFGLSALSSGQWLDLITQVGFSGSLLIALTGRPSRNRTIAAVVTFIVGYGSLFAVVLLARLL